MKKQISPPLFSPHYSKKGWVIFFAFFGTFSLTPTLIIFAQLPKEYYSLTIGIQLTIYNILLFSK